MRAGPAGLTRGFATIAVIGAAVALSACSTTTAIRPGDLPIVAAEAERGSDAARHGRLDAVVVTLRSRREAEDRYAAPLSARIDGVSLVVASEGREHRYAPGDIKSVEIQRYDTQLAIIAGTALTTLGAAAILLGAVAVGGYTHETKGNQLLAITLGFPLVTGGVGLAAGGVPLIIAGARDPWASRPKLR
jgi:hypothetical protein